MFISEQQLVAAAVGLSVRGYTPFAATFAAFFTRAYDFVRMAAISRANIRLVGTHAGVEIGLAWMLLEMPAVELLEQCQVLLLGRSFEPGRRIEIGDPRFLRS